MNAKLIKKRVGSIKNIRKITRALEMVSAAKIQAAQDKALSAKPFSEKIFELIQTFDATGYPNIPLLRQPEKFESSLYVVFSTNRGLAGSLNTNLFRVLGEHLRDNRSAKHFITVGQKGQPIAKTEGDLIADFSELNAESSANIVTAITESFVNAKVDQVFLVYSDFINALKQAPTIKRILPIQPTEISERDRDDTSKYNFDPDAETLLTTLLPFYLEVQVNEVLSEAEASEHSARMVAMKSATENAHKLSQTLTLEYNRARQQMITNEINDIVTAKMSLAKSR